MTKMEKKTREIYEWICPRCKKVITSLNENQADYNKKLHQQKCEGKK